MAEVWPLIWFYVKIRVLQRNDTSSDFEGWLIDFAKANLIRFSW